MKKAILGVILGATLAVTNVAQAHAVCNDGWLSQSYGSGSCSYHDGVSYWYNSGDYHSTQSSGGYSSGGGYSDIDGKTAALIGLAAILLIYGEAPEEVVEEEPAESHSSSFNWN